MFFFCFFVFFLGGGGVESGEGGEVRVNVNEKVKFLWIFKRTNRGGGGLGASDRGGGGSGWWGSG